MGHLFIEIYTGFNITFTRIKRLRLFIYLYLTIFNFTIKSKGEASYPPLQQPHTHDRKSEGGRKPNGGQARKLQPRKITDAKTTRRNFTDEIRDDAKG